MRAARAGQEANGGFWQRHLRLGFGNAQIAGQRHFQAAAHGVAVDGGNRHAAKIGEGFKRLAKQPRHFARHRRVAVGKHIQVGAGREKLAALASEHQRVDVAVGVQFVHQLDQAVQAVGVPGVGRWVADGDQRGVLLNVQQQVGVVCHRMSSAPPGRRMARATITRMISLVPSRIWCTRLSRT